MTSSIYLLQHALASGQRPPLAAVWPSWNVQHRKQTISGQRQTASEHANYPSLDVSYHRGTDRSLDGFAASEGTHVLVTGGDLGLEVLPVEGGLVGLHVGHQDEHEARAKDGAHVACQERVVQTCAAQPFLSACELP